MNFIQKNKKLHIAIFIVLMLFGVFLFINYYNQKDKDFLPYFYGFGIQENEQYLDIEPERASKLIRYFINQEGNYNKAKFWNQTCLFFETKYCKELTLFWGLKEEHDKIREQYFLEDQNNLYLLIEGEKDTEENRCYVIFYKAQNDLNQNKKIFLDNYQTCRKYYMESMPALLEYEEKFLKIFSDDYAKYTRVQ